MMQEDGKAIQNGVFSSSDVDVRPVQDSAEEVKTYGEKVITVPFTKPELKAGAEYFVNISFKLKEDASWAKKGHEVAHGQIAVPFDVPEVTALKTEDLGGLGLEDSQDSAVITGKDFTVTFDKTAGTIKDFTYKGKSCLRAARSLISGEHLQIVTLDFIQGQDMIHGDMQVKTKQYLV